MSATENYKNNFLMRQRMAGDAGINYRIWILDLQVTFLSGLCQ